jgi:uncharacterized protein YfdQ (DUF2303 family)
MSETDSIADLVGSSILSKLEPRFMKNSDGREFLLIPPGNTGSMAGAVAQWQHIEVTPPNKLEVLAPKLITQAVQLQTVDAFNAYMHRFKNEDSVIFADIAASRIFGVIDYHSASDEGLTKPEARHTKHTAMLTIPPSLEWGIWTGIDGRMMKHVDFSNFLEENAPDIMPLGQMKDHAGNLIEDAPTTLFELVRELQVRSTYGAASEIRNGDYASIEMQKGDDVTTKRNVSIPVAIDLRIPVYFGEAPIYMKALVRRKVDSGSLSLGFKLVRPEQHRQDEFKRIVGEIEADVGLTTLYGKPA